MIRKAAKADVKPLAALFRQLHMHHIKIAPESHKMPFEGYFTLEMQSFLEDEKTSVFLEELDGEITAYSVVNIFERERAERTYAKILYIEHFTVGEEFRRHGCGTRLFEFLKGYAEENGCDLIQLGAAAGNSEALSFYESMGMKPKTIRLELKL